jgi:phage/plasmid-like protein (TIGR03299 family)
MSHDLCIEQGKAKLFYHGEAPWHGLGQRLDGPATSHEAIQAAGLDWAVEKVPLQLVLPDRKVPIPDRFALVRSDRLKAGGNAHALGIVGRDYTPLQNRDAFAFFDGLVGGPDKAIYHTAGALGDGERVWLLAKLPGEMVVASEDTVEKFLLLSTSHDGQSSIQIKFTPIRVVCQNTLTMALSQGPSIHVSHRKGAKAQLEWAVGVLGILRRHFMVIEQDFKAMAVRSLDGKALEDFMDRVFPLPTGLEEGEEGSLDHQPPLQDSGSKERRLNRILLQRQAVLRLWDQGVGSEIPSVRHSLWTAYNAVTEMVDHYSRQEIMTPDNRDRHLNGAWFKDGYLLKGKAFKVAKEMVNAAA